METQSDTPSNEKKITAFDFGNSRVKVYSTGLLFNFSYKDKNWFKILTTVLIHPAAIKCLYAYSTVNRRKSNPFFKQVHKNDIPFLDITTLLKKTELIHYKHIQGIGNDRLLGLIGGLIHVKPPFITIDCGTAVTVNALDSDNNVIGGAIFPGINTQAKSLDEHTSALKFVNISDTKFIIGTNTNAAIKFGILGSVIGGIKELVKQLENKAFHRKKVPLLVTGGHWDMMYQAIKLWRKDTIECRYLVLEGIKYLLEKEYKEI